jgi:Family of unknown function (DUF5996)
MPADETRWPELDWSAWEPTATTLHMWTQIVGKVRLALCPPQPHWWQVALYVSARGLSTAAMPTGDRMIEIEFDFVSHELHFRLNTGASLSMPLRAQSVAAFYQEFLRCLELLGVNVHIYKMPVELKSPISFDQDTVHASYDPEYAHRFWRVLVSADQVFQSFSSSFIGKTSPVHFFWGSFDLAVTRFSGRRAPERADADTITREAYSHEVISAGFWPGNGGYGEAAFYCYAAPSPTGLPEARVQPPAAYFDTNMGEFLLRYSDVRQDPSPDAALRAFLDSTYAVAADKAGWDRAALERPAHP